MKKLLLTLVVALGFCGSIIAQGYESHWPDFYGPAYMFQGGCVAAIAVDGTIVTAEYPGWDAFEVAFFVGEECRGAGSDFPDAYPAVYYLYNGYVEDLGDPYPVIDGAAVYYDNTGEEVSVKIFDHINGIEYDVTVTYLGEPFTIITGDDNFQGWDDPENPIIFNISTGATPGQTFTKEIIGYGDDPEVANYWYFIASPVEEDVVPTVENGFLTEVHDFFYFDQAYYEAEWRGYDEESFNVVNGKGYLYASATDTELSFTGTPFTGDDGYAEVELVYDGTEGHAWYGWNLVGNPFAFDAYADRPFYRLDPETGLYVECTEDDIVPMMEGIFVQTGEGVEETEMMSFYAATTGEGGGDDLKKIVINVNAGRGLSDRAIIRFDGGKQLGKQSFRQNETQVYIPVEGKDYAVVNAPEMGEMPVSFKAESNGSYMLSFSNKNIAFNYLHLIDNMTGADVDLLVPEPVEGPASYTFNAQTTDYASRFKLVFATGNNSDDNFAFFSNGSFVISNEGEAVLKVVDVTGRILNNETINGSANVHVDAAPGVYMLRLISGNSMKVQKVVVD